MTHDSYLQNLFAERIGGVRFGKDTAIYKFEKIKRAKRAAVAANPGVELFDLGVGEPDEMAFPEIVETPGGEARKPENRGYADNGGEPLKAAGGALSGQRVRRDGRCRYASDPLHRQQAGAWGCWRRR